MLLAQNPAFTTQRTKIHVRSSAEIKMAEGEKLFCSPR